MSRVTTKHERVTPSMAERYLAMNDHNRSLRASTVSRLAAAIRRGEWADNGETIKFNGDGKLIDGQHRLAAIVEADRAVDALIVRGLTLASQETVDTGLRRNPADVLGLRGFPHGSVVAAACKGAYAEQRFGNLGGLHGGEYPTHQQIVDAAEGDRVLLIRVAEFAVDFREDHAELGLSPAMLGELTYAFARKWSYEEATAFFDAVSASDGNGPALLRRALIEDRLSHKRLSRNMKMAFSVKAFNAWITASPIQRLRWKRARPHRERFPEIAEKTA